MHLPLPLLRQVVLDRDEVELRIHPGQITISGLPKDKKEPFDAHLHGFLPGQMPPIRGFFLCLFWFASLLTDHLRKWDSKKSSSGGSVFPERS